MMLDLGTTVRDGVPEYKLKREHALGRTPRRQEHSAADGRGIPQGEPAGARSSGRKVQRDSINYFPPMATQACRIGFFAEPTARRWRGTKWRCRTAAGASAGCSSRFPAASSTGSTFLQREVREVADSRAFPHPHRRGRAHARQELRRHPQAGPGRLQAEEVTAMAAVPAEEVNAAPGLHAPCTVVKTTRVQAARKEDIPA